MYYKRRKKYEKSKAEFLYELFVCVLIVGFIIYSVLSGDGSGVDNTGFE